MDDVQLEEYPKTTSVFAQAVNDGDNGFATQPEYDRKYHPNEDRRGMHSTRLAARSGGH